MPVKSIQLPIETALKSYLESKNLGGEYFNSDRTIHAGHAIEALPESGNFIAIMADPPDWFEMVINAECHVVFHVATQVRNPNSRDAAATDHGAAVGAIIDLFSDQNFPASRDEINAAQSGPFQIGFTGWIDGWGEAKPQSDSYGDAQIITRIPYTFQTFIASAESS